MLFDELLQVGNSKFGDYSMEGGGKSSYFSITTILFGYCSQTLSF